jgi:hypothetical protein
MCRGLAEYIEDISFDAQGGRRLVFQAVHEEYAEPEKQASYPSAVIRPRGEGVYEGRGLTPGADPAERLPPPDLRYLVVPCDYVTTLAVEVWANDTQERAVLVMALEQAFMPNSSKWGFDLELPHYFNIRANYALRGLSTDDDADQALRRYRLATVTLAARVPVVQMFTFPDAKPVFRLEAIGTGSDVLVNLSVR